MTKKYSGVLVTFEGGDKLGKSTQLRKLAESLGQEGLPVVVSREPGGTEAGLVIRELLLNPKYKLSKATEMLLFQADRAQNYKEVLKPALKMDKIVICDRYIDSTLVYQGRLLGWSLPLLFRLHTAITGALMPDITFVFVGEPFTREGADSIELRTKETQNRIQDEYKHLATTHRRYVLVDANRDEEVIATELLEKVRSILGSD